MLTTRGVLLSCCTASLIFSQAAPKKQLTARELFYAAAQAPAAAKNDTARPPAKRPARPKPVEIATADVKPVASPTTASAVPPPAPAHTTAPMPTGGAPPLGLALHRPQTCRR